MISTKSEKKERLEAFSRLKKVSALHPFYRAPTEKELAFLEKSCCGSRGDIGCRNAVGGTAYTTVKQTGTNKNCVCIHRRCADAGKNHT